ncbi:MAG: 1-acyl-sn-glycerol-3-phosphate acyltransferase [Ignavibacteria bacterium]|nr:1-acyl-sn-glycerol-3-phosphate acyltransferase [Ignavibacteria bacterium]
MVTYIRLFFLYIYTGICSVFALLFNIDRSFRLYFWLSKVFSNGILWISGIKLHVEGTENINPEEAYVYVSNHSSMYDIPAIMAAVPNKASIVFKKELARIPIFGWQLATGPYVLMDRQNPERAMQSIERAKKLMTLNKISTILYAEGTRSKTGEIQPFKRGAFYLASRVQHPIVPVTIKGTEKILPKGTLRIHPGVITVVFDKPIEVAPVMNKKDEMELMDKVREIIIRNKEKD